MAPSGGELRQNVEISKSQTPNPCPFALLQKNMDIDMVEPSDAPTARQKSIIEPMGPDSEALALKQHATEAQQVYGRGKQIRTRSVKDKKLRYNLKSLENKYRDATLQAKNAEILLEHSSGFLEPENALERTYKVRQDEIRADVAVETAKNGFELKLEGLGPYDVCEYTRNGRELLIAGRKGHVATMDWRDGKLGCELQLAETIRDAKWLHNNQSFAVAQKKNVFIYAKDGVEIHRLGKHVEVTHMEFLPYHFLLSTVVSYRFFLTFTKGSLYQRSCQSVQYQDGF